MRSRSRLLPLLAKFYNKRFPDTNSRFLWLAIACAGIFFIAALLETRDVSAAFSGPLGLLVIVAFIAGINERLTGGKNSFPWFATFFASIFFLALVVSKNVYQALLLLLRIFGISIGPP